MKLHEIMGDIMGTNKSAVTDKAPAYKKSRKKFKKNALAMDYEKLKEKKKKRKNLKENIDDIKDEEIDLEFMADEAIKNLENHGERRSKKRN